MILISIMGVLSILGTMLWSKKHFRCGLRKKIQEGCHTQFVGHENLYNFLSKHSKKVILVCSVEFSGMPNTVVPSQIICDVVTKIQDGCPAKLMGATDYSE